MGSALPTCAQGPFRNLIARQIVRMTNEKKAQERLDRGYSARDLLAAEFCPGWPARRVDRSPAIRFIRDRDLAMPAPAACGDD
jgi:hypothetical protein